MTSLMVLKLMVILNCDRIGFQFYDIFNGIKTTIDKIPEHQQFQFYDIFNGIKTFHSGTDYGTQFQFYDIFK